MTNYNYGMLRNGLALDIAPRVNDITTTVYKFSLNGEKVTYLSKGDVPGTILNQYSMDENGDISGIATTTGQVWGTVKIFQNNVYVWAIPEYCGKHRRYGTGEQIYSVRFMGDRGYVVTFKTVIHCLLLT